MTLGLWAAGRFPAKNVVAYIMVQVVGGIIAANGYGEHSTGGYSMGAAIVSEVVLTAGLG